MPADTSQSHVPSCAAMDASAYRSSLARTVSAKDRSRAAACSSARRCSRRLASSRSWSSATASSAAQWLNRSRALVADAWEQVEVPLAEDLESYDVQILDGAAIKRTLTSTTTSVLYTAAQQTADWGALLGPGRTLALRIFQLSNRLGRGTPAAVTMQF